MRMRVIIVILFLCQGFPVLAQNYGAQLYSGAYHSNGMYGLVNNTHYTVFEQAVVNDNSKSVYWLVQENEDGSRVYKGSETGNSWAELVVDASYDILEKWLMDTGYLPYIGRYTMVINQNQYVKGHVDVPQTVYVPVPVPVAPPYGYGYGYGYQTYPTWHPCPYCHGSGRGHDTIQYITSGHTEWCPRCGTYSLTHVHRSLSCGYCGGSGMVQY